MATPDHSSQTQHFEAVYQTYAEQLAALRRRQQAVIDRFTQALQTRQVEKLKNRISSL